MGRERDTSHSHHPAAVPAVEGRTRDPYARPVYLEVSIDVSTVF